MAVYAYCRVSTGRQAEEGESLDVQRRQVEGYATMLGLQIDHVYVERGVSGSKPLSDRPEGARLLAVLQDGDTVIAPKLDRMFRSASDALAVGDDLKKRSISLHFIDLGGDVTGNGISKLVFTILSAVAEAERDRIRERIRDVKIDQRQRRRFLGGAKPFGYRIGDDGELVPDEREQAALARIRELRAGGMALRRVAESVSAETGVKVSHMLVKRLAGIQNRAVAT
jgi:DNA invertase Pin-like site-specific DNA recombinase